MREESRGRSWRVWAGIGVSLASLAAIFLFISPAEIIAALRTARYDYVLLAALSLVAFLALRAVRWRFMLAGGLGTGRGLPWTTVFHIQNIGYLLNNLLPLRLGDVSRAVLIGNVPPLTISRGLSTMVVERVLDLLFIVVLFPFTVAAAGDLPPELRTGVQIVGLITVAAAAGLVLAAARRELFLRLAGRFLALLPRLNAEAWLRRVNDLLLGLDSLSRPRDAIVLLSLSIAVWIPIILGYYIGIRAVHLDVSLTMAAFVVCAAALSVAAPSSPGQFGVFEAGVILALSTVLGMPEAQAASFAFMYHAVNYIVIGLLGALGFLSTTATFSTVLASTRQYIRTGAGS